MVARQEGTGVDAAAKRKELVEPMLLCRTIYEEMSGI